MNDKRKDYQIETFRPLEDLDKTTSERPTGRPSVDPDKPVQIGGGSIINQPSGGKKPKG
jgi:hypothetical protein